MHRDSGNRPFLLSFISETSETPPHASLPLAFLSFTLSPRLTLLIRLKMARKGSTRKPGESLPDKVDVRRSGRRVTDQEKARAEMESREKDDRKREQMSKRAEEASHKQLASSFAGLTKSRVNCLRQHLKTNPLLQRQKSIRDFFSRREDVPAKSEPASVETAETDKEKGKRDASVSL